MNAAKWKSTTGRSTGSGSTAAVQPQHTAYYCKSIVAHDAVSYTYILYIQYTYTAYTISYYYLLYYLLFTIYYCLFIMITSRSTYVITLWHALVVHIWFMILHTSSMYLKLWSRLHAKLVYCTGTYSVSHVSFVIIIALIIQLIGFRY